jgi:cob(I)alamin adenosyltransferase
LTLNVAFVTLAAVARKQANPPSKAPFKGLVELFTGDGKGKTSAALGIALRALGCGKRVHIVYFMKGGFPYNEQKALAHLPNVSYERFGGCHFVNPNDVSPEDREQARKALAAAREAMLSGKYDVVVLDEVNIAAAWGLVDTAEVVRLIRERPENVELILTGRYAPKELVELADLVTEMVNVKHPYDKGVPSREGIDY